MTPAVFYNENRGNKSSPPSSTKKERPNHSVHRCQDRTGSTCKHTDTLVSWGKPPASEPFWRRKNNLGPCRSFIWWCPSVLNRRVLTLSAFGGEKTSRHNKVHCLVCNRAPGSAQTWYIQHLNLEAKPQKRHSVHSSRRQRPAQASGLEERALKGDLEKVIRTVRCKGGWVPAGPWPSAPPQPVAPGRWASRQGAHPVAVDRQTPGGHSSIVEGHPDNLETLPNELCRETFSFAASLLMHIKKWYARPHLIHWFYIRITFSFTAIFTGASLIFVEYNGIHL